MDSSTLLHGLFLPKTNIASSGILSSLRDDTKLQLVFMSILNSSFFSSVHSIVLDRWHIRCKFASLAARTDSFNSEKENSVIMFIDSITAVPETGRSCLGSMVQITSIPPINLFD